MGAYPEDNDSFSSGFIRHLPRLDSSDRTIFGKVITHDGFNPINPDGERESIISTPNTIKTEILT
jgi:hypothetical protein